MKRFLTLLTAALFTLTLIPTPTQAVNLEDLTDRYPEEYAKTRALLDPQCWTRLTCEESGGELDPSGKEKCASALLPAGPDFEVGYCNITRIGSGQVRLNIPLPGLGCGPVQEGETPLPNSASCVENIGQWIQRIYIFAIAFGSLIAVIILMHTGFSYVTSSGNPEMIQTAKKKIANALIGLLLLLGSYTLLNTINPDLVNLRPPTVKKFRTATEIHKHVLEVLAGGDTTKSFPACETAWVMRLRGYLVDEQDNNDYTEPEDAELVKPENRNKYDRLNVTCGMLVPTGRGDQPVCLATFCSESNSICALVTDPATGGVSIEFAKTSGCIQTAGETSALLIEKPGSDKPYKVTDLNEDATCGEFDDPDEIGTKCLTIDKLSTGNGTTCHVMTNGSIASLFSYQPGQRDGLKLKGSQVSSKTPRTGYLMRCEPPSP